MQGTPIHSTKAYWDDRAEKGLAKDDLVGVLFDDLRFYQYEKLVKLLLKSFREKTVLDVACGYGRLARCFSKDNYIGVDFSTPFIEKAKELNKGYSFVENDIHKYKPSRKFDIVMEVNSLKSLNMTAGQFIEKYGKYAKEFVMCLEADDFIIKPVYKL